MKSQKIKGIPGIIWIVLASIAGYMGAAWLLNSNIAQYTSFPDYLVVHVTDQRLGKEVELSFPIRSGFPADSIQEKLGNEKLTGSKVHTDQLIVNQIPVLLLWSILICLMFGFATGAAVYLFFRNRDLRSRYSYSGKENMLAILFAVIITVLVIVPNMMFDGMWQVSDIINQLHVMQTNGHVIIIIVVISVLLFFPGFITIMLVVNAAEKVTGEKTDKAILLRHFRYLNGVLQTVLQIMAILVVFSVLTSTALGHTLRSMVKIEGYSIYPPEVSYIYGLFFTFFLCILYIPSHVWLKHCYHNLTATDAPDTNQKEEQSLFNETMMNQIKIAFTVLSPLITSFLPEQFHFLG